MSGPIELPPTYVLAYPEAGPSTGTASLNFGPVKPPMTPFIQFMQNQGARKAFANGVNIFNAANKGDVEATLAACLSGFNGLSPAVFKNQLKMHADCQRSIIAASLGSASPYATKDYSLTETEYSRAYFYRAQDTDRIAAQHYDFFGTAIMPVAGIYYWLFGGGQTRYVNIGALNLSMVPSDFKPVMDMVATNGPGTYSINSPFQYNAFRFMLNLWAAGLLGRVNGNVVGTLNILADGTWTFDGSYTINPDKYDADHSNRTYMQEKLTDFLRYLGDTFGSNDYQIVIEGSQSIHLSGTK